MLSAKHERLFEKLFGELQDEKVSEKMIWYLRWAVKDIFRGVLPMHLDKLIGKLDILQDIRPGALARALKKLLKAKRGRGRRPVYKKIDQMKKDGMKWPQIVPVIYEEWSGGDAWKSVETMNQKDEIATVRIRYTSSKNYSLTAQREKNNKSAKPRKGKRNHHTIRKRLVS